MKMYNHSRTCTHSKAILTGFHQQALVKSYAYTNDTEDRVGTETRLILRDFLFKYSK